MALEHQGCASAIGRRRFRPVEEDNSNFEGEGVESYLPRADPEISHVENSEVMEEDDELMDFEVKFKFSVGKNIFD